jgi:ferric-dicitrate binding protein FerR (iron transport regulator)
VRFDAIDEVTVTSGRIYADSGASIDNERSITIHTDLGSATDIGTQFAVVYLDGKMSIAVREGSVDVSDHRGTYTAQAGDRLTLRPDSEVAFEKIPLSDPSWNWAVELAPAFDIENRPLMDFLKWAARETGKELVFESDRVRAAARITRLHGSVTGFSPSEALDAVRPTTQFTWSVDERQIVIAALQE